MRVTKQSNNYADEESYEIWGDEEMVAGSPTLTNFELIVSEFCVNSTFNNQYTLKMKDSYGDSWDNGAWIMIEGLYGNRVYKGFMTGFVTEDVPLSLYYGIMKNDQWKLTSGSVAGSWTEYAFDDSTWTEVTLGSVSGLVSGTHYLRKTFTGLSSMAAYELSMYFKYGLVAYINGIEVVRDNMPEGAITSSTLAVGSYASLNYHSFIRPGNEVANDQSILAIELHYLSAAGQSDVDFDAFLAIYASTTKPGEKNCYVYPYIVALTSSEGSNVISVFNWNKGDYFSASSGQLPLSITYGINEMKAMVNGVRIWPSSSSFAPSSFTLKGKTISSSTWTTVFSASNLVYDSNAFLSIQGYFNTRLYDEYSVEISSSNSDYFRGYEIQLMTCAHPIDLTIGYTKLQYSYYTNYQRVNIAPITSDFTNCQISPSPPSGLTFDQRTCTLYGIALYSQSYTNYTVTSIVNGAQYSGSFQLRVLECTGTFVLLLRVYDSYANQETFSIKDVSTQQIIYSDASRQVNNQNVYRSLCLTGSKYSIEMSSNVNAWKSNSFLYVFAYLGYGEYDTIVRVRYDEYLDLNPNPIINIHYSIKPKESWFFKMGDVPNNWYDNNTSGWTSSGFGSFPRSSNQIQLYKKTFTVTSLDDVSGIMINLKYRYGCVVYLNNHEAFSLGVSGDLSNSTVSSISLSSIQYRQISLPPKPIIVG